MVVPRPGEDGVAGGRVGRDRERELPVHDGAVADERLDHLEGRALVVRQRQLARAPVVRRAVPDRDRLRAALAPGRHRGPLRLPEVLQRALARVVRHAAQRRVDVVVDGVARVRVLLGRDRGRVDHVDVGGDGAGQSGDHGQSELHFEMLVGWLLLTFSFSFVLVEGEIRPSSSVMCFLVEGVDKSFLFCM